MLVEEKKLMPFRFPLRNHINRITVCSFKQWNVWWFHFAQHQVLGVHAIIWISLQTYSCRLCIVPSYRGREFLMSPDHYSRNTLEHGTRVCRCKRYLACKLEFGRRSSSLLKIYIVLRRQVSNQNASGVRQLLSTLQSHSPCFTYTDDTPAASNIHYESGSFALIWRWVWQLNLGLVYSQNSWFLSGGSMVFSCPHIWELHIGR